MTSRRPRSIALFTTALLLATAASGCGFFNKGADARNAGEAFATALQDGDVGKLEFTETDAPKEYAAAMKSLGDPSVKVDVDQVTRSGDTATVTLAWSVDVNGEAWKHETEAELVDKGGDWQVDWKPSI